MKIYKTNEIKNISIIGSAGSGKTTLVESMLFEGGVISRRGEVEAHNTASDYHLIEQEYGGSVFSTVVFTEWNGKKINFIDTPGADDFVGGVISALHVAHTGVMVVNAQNGVEVGTELIWRHAERMKKPIIFAINQLDHDNSNYDKTMEELHQQFGNKVIPVQYPITQGAGFDAVIDVLLMKMYKWGPDGGEPEILDIPAAERDKAAEMHNILVEAAAENDEELMEIFFEQESLTEDQMRQGIHKGLVKRDLFPVFCISAKRDMAIRRFMEFVINVAPSPNEAPDYAAKDGTNVACDAKGPTSIYVFKISQEEHLGEVFFFKVLSGEVEEGMDLVNNNRGSKERLSQLFDVAGKKREKVSKLIAGDIGATVKLKDTKIFNTLTDKKVDWVMPDVCYPQPKYRTAIKAVNESEEEKLSEALQKMHTQDPTLIVEYSKELKQVIVHGQGEHHLNTLKWFLSNLYKIETEFISPRIPYRETITKAAKAMYRHKKQSGGAGQFGEVHLVIEPYEEGVEGRKVFKIDGSELVVNVRGTDEYDMPWGGKLILNNCIVGGVIDTKYLPAIMKGINDKMEFGPLTGSYARDIRVSVYDGKMHPVDSNEISFKIAGSKAFAEAFKNAGPKILEPIYNVEILVPSDKMGDVMSDLQNRRAIVQGMNSEGGYEKLTVKAPLAELNRYSTILSSLTSGRATFTMEYAEYAPVPHELQEELLKKHAEEQEED